MKKTILGITAFNHDSSACLIQENKIIAFCEEERFNYQKHSGAFPTKSIKYCLDSVNISIEDIDIIAFYMDSNKLWLNYIANNHPLKFLSINYISRRRYFFELIWLLGFQNKLNSIKDYLNDFKGKIVFVPHHEAHVWYGYFASGFESCTVLSNDSMGESKSVQVTRFDKNDEEIKTDLVFSQNDPHSIGYLYGAITEYLGFRRGSDEGKVMALASFGTNKYVNYFQNSCKLIDGGIFVFNKDIVQDRNFQPKGQRLSDKFIKKFGEPLQYGDKFKQKHFDIAHGLQKLTEKILKHQVKNIPDGKIVITGGVAQNSVANGMLTNTYPDKNIFVTPIPNDAGCSMGAALYAEYKINKKWPKYINTAFLGPKYLVNSIKKELENNKIKYTQQNDSTNFIVDNIAQNKVVAIMRGRMECGPRALGHRTILASPISPKMKDYLNNQVKFRESFRPYGCLVLEKDVKRLFEHQNHYVEGPYMSFVYKVKKEWKSKIPALVHVDGTVRVQIIKEGSDPWLEKLITIFGNKTRVPIVINTSFNLAGFPIVRSTREALISFYNSAIDSLVFENSIIVSK